MVKFENYIYLQLLTYLGSLTATSTFPLEDRSVNLPKNATLIPQLTKSQHQLKSSNINYHNNTKTKDAKNQTDLVMAAAEMRQQNLPVLTKPRGFRLPKNHSAQQNQKDSQQPAAQNYYNHYFPDLPPLGHTQPYYSLTEDPIITKFLNHQSKQFQPRQPPLTAYDASILGSGDFGILRGGTFYSEEDQTYSNEEGSEIYYGDASNTHTVSSTEGFIQKYTYPEEQFAQFRDFADLGAPADSAFSQYVVVYANKNSTSNAGQNSKPKNIFEQLQEIDKEKEMDEKKFRKNQPKASITKLKLVRTKLMEKKWVQRQPVKVADDDPLIALS